MTCISILAVDFSVFPRSSAKTSEFGISLMDMGGAFFVVSSGLTSKWARRLPSHSSLLQKRTVMVGGLGVVRLVTVKCLGYQEVAEEYGVHWNFFFSLAAVWVLSDIAHALSRRCIVESEEYPTEIFVLLRSLTSR